jgi:5-methylcytosine-specific restriction endonuclease McrA
VVQQSGGGRSLMARKNRQISNTELRLQAAFENKGISHIVKADSISVMKEEDQGDKLTNDKLSRGDIYELVEHLVGNPEKNLISEVKTEDAKRVHILKTDCGDDKWSKVDIPKLADMTYPPIALHKKGKGGKRPPKAAMESAQVETKRTGLKRPPFELEDVPPSGDVRDFSGSKESTGQVRVEELKELRLRGALVPYQETPLSIGAASTKRITTFCTYCLEWFPSESLDSDHIITSELLGKQLLELNKKLAEYPKLIDVFIIDFTNRGISWQLFFMQNTAKQWVVTQRGWELIFQNLKNLVFACKRCNQVERNDTETVEFLEKMLFFGDTFVRYMEAQKPEWKEDLKQSRMPGLTEYILNYVQSQQHTMAAIEAFKKKFELDMEVVQRVRKYARKMSPEESEAAKKEGAGGMLKVKLMQDAAATVMEQAKTPGRGGEEWNQGDAEELIESLAFQASRLGSVEPYNQLYQEVEFLRMQHDMDVDKIHELQKSEEEKGKLLAEKIEESKRLLAELEKFKQSAPVPPK